MKRILIGALAIGAVVNTSQISAQSYKPVTLGVAAGAAIPVGDLSDHWNTGYNGTAMLSLHSTGTPLGLRFEGAYNHFSGRDDAGNPPDIRVVGGVANLVYNLPGRGITPYLIGGVGYYGVKPEDRDSENKLGINGGIGALFPLSGFNTFVEARFHHVFTENPGVINSATQFVPVTFGILF